MESSPKRRRTSPRLAAQEQAESTTPIESPPNPAARAERPSYASPTKASMGRSNPEILRRRESSPRKERSNAGDKGDLAALEAGGASQPDEGISEGATKPSRGFHVGALRSEAFRSSQTIGSKNSLGGLAAPARRTPRPNPRPLPPPGPEEEDIAANPFTGRGLRRSFGVIPEKINISPEPEPELPPTPEHPDPVVSTPPSGIHNTPSRRPRRSRALADSMRSSPLKPPPIQFPPKGQSKESMGVNEPRLLEDTRNEEDLHTRALRGIKPSDSYWRKKRQRDSLLAGISQLEKDLDIVTAENERIWESQLKRRKLSPSKSGNGIIDVLKRRALRAEKEAPSHTDSSWTQALLNSAAFLPFGKHSASLPTLFRQEESTGEDDQLPTSHHPLSMTAEEALPFLQVFTPLSFSSQISPLPRDSEDGGDGPLLQKHSIAVSSTNPPGFFNAQIEMIVNTQTLAITRLSVPRLEPAATYELLPFIQTLVRVKGANSALTKNVSVLTWAMGEWLRLAVRRAKVWHLLDREIGTKDGLAETVSKLRTRKKRRRRRKGASEVDNDSDGADEQDDSGGPSTMELLPYMGKTSIDFQIPHLLEPDNDVSNIRVQWKIHFDWTGEAQSKIGLLVGAPGRWHKIDEKRRLAGIPALFDKLLEEEADLALSVKTVATLLTGDPRP